MNDAYKKHLAGFDNMIDRLNQRLEVVKKEISDIETQKENLKYTFTKEGRLKFAKMIPAVSSLIYSIVDNYPNVTRNELGDTYVRDEWDFQLFDVSGTVIGNSLLILTTNVTKEDMKDINNVHFTYGDELRYSDFLDHNIANDDFETISNYIGAYSYVIFIDADNRWYLNLSNVIYDILIEPALKDESFKEELHKIYKAETMKLKLTQ